MPERLLDRQVRLLEHLTSRVGIFDTTCGISNSPALHGLDLALLHLEARFSHEKRMRKIESVLRRTLELLGRRREGAVRDFVDACPPTSISWLENARQFHRFLQARWLCEAPEPTYLPDVAAYEIAYATVRAGANVLALDAPAVPPGTVRRHPGAVLLRCTYDISPIILGADRAPEMLEIRLAVAVPPAADEPLVSQLSPQLFGLLEALDPFVELGAFEGSSEVTRLIEDLAALGLVEVLA